MCGRYELDEKTTDIALWLGAVDEFPDWRPQYSVAVADTVPIVRERDGRRVVPAVWDFKPRPREKGRPQFNAKIETVNINSFWRGSFRHNRCVVPMRGYFEWEKLIENGEEVKQPHFLHADGLLAAAGLATAYKDGDDWHVSTVIITREARDASGEVHPRMPAFLTDDVVDEWLGGELDTEAESEHMLELLTDVSAGVASTLTSYRVDRKLNFTKTLDPYDPTLVEPI